MLKDTKSLGNNKAPACESRGFVLKKEGVLFDTPSFCTLKPENERRHPHPQRPDRQGGRMSKKEKPPTPSSRP